MSLERQSTRPRHHWSRPLQELCFLDSEYGQRCCCENRLSENSQKPLVSGRPVITHHHGLWHIGLDERDCTQREQNLNQGRIGFGKLIEIGNQSDGGLGTSNVERVFEADGQTVKWTSKLAALSQLV